MVGDGYCNDKTNNLPCGFDQGDCCNLCTSKEYCSDCECLTGNVGKEVSDALIGDGYCHDVANNAECNYDGGDCCQLEQNVKTDHCLRPTECVCRVQETCASDGGHPLAGDGFCNDETNIEGCLFDGLDCCEIVGYDYTKDPITTYCEECVCHGTVMEEHMNTLVHFMK